jgi:hypothetical protein
MKIWRGRDKEIRREMRSKKEMGREIEIRREMEMELNKPRS